MKRKFFFLLLIFLYLSSQAQELTIKSFTELTNDITARSNPRNDLNDNPCALIKVRVAIESVKFKGMVVGDVNQDGNEYFVYLPQGAKRLTIDAPNYLPLDIIFEDNGITSLISKTTYLLIISKPESQTISSRKEIFFDITPTNARLYVDDLEEDVSLGKAKVRLSNGQHRYRVESEYYTSKEAEFTVTDDMVNSPIYVSLFKGKGCINVSSTPIGAKVYLDKHAIGITPIINYETEAGFHNVILSKDGYSSISQVVEIDMNKSVNLDKTLSSNVDVHIISTPSSAVYIDNKYMGYTPLKIDCEVGKHQLKLLSAGYKALEEEFEIKSNKPRVITKKLHKSHDTQKRIKISSPRDKSKDLIKKNSIYTSLNYTYNKIQSIGLTVGTYLKNINLELGIDYSFFEDGLLDCALKAGYGIKCSSRFLVTPQIGIAFAGADGSPGIATTDFTCDICFQYALNKCLALSLVPTYDLSIYNGEGYNNAVIQNNYKSPYIDFSVKLGFVVFVPW